MTRRYQRQRHGILHAFAARRHHKRKRHRWHDACDCDCFDCDCLPLMVVGSLLRLVGIRTPGRAPSPRPTAPGRAGMAAIRGYQRWLSPWLPTRCRHRPTCSAYGLEAVRRYGFVVGVRLTAGRLRRCNASAVRGTVDPVP